MRARDCLWKRSLDLGIVALLCCALSASIHASPKWRLIPVELDGDEETVVSDFALGAEGVPWVIISEPEYALCYRDRDTWRLLTRIEGIDSELSPFPFSRLHVTPMGEVYLHLVPTTQGVYRRRATVTSARRTAVQMDKRDRLYRLANGRATHVTDCPGPSAQGMLKMFFDSKGRIWQCGQMFIAKYEDGRWESVEASVGDRVNILEDARGSVYFFGAKVLSYYRDGQFTINVRLPNELEKMKRPTCCLWGPDKALFASYKGGDIVALDLESFEAASVIQGQSRSPIPSVGHMFRDRQGDAWALGRLWHDDGRYCYAEISAETGQVNPKPETAGIHWSSYPGNGMREAFCYGSDGTMYFGLQRGGVNIYREGTLTHVGWQDGLPIRHAIGAYEHGDGTVWFATERTGMAVYDPRGTDERPASTRFLDTWAQFDLASWGVVQDFSGRLWCFLKDRPGCLSGWDGQQWEHFDVSMDADTMGISCVDQLDRLHLMLFREQKSVACRVEGQNRRTFASIQDMLVDSGKSGSRTFRVPCFTGYFPPLIVEPNEIWLARRGSPKLELYDGIQWQHLKAPERVRNLFHLPDGRVVVAVDKRYLTFYGGRWVDVPNEYASPDRFLAGEQGRQMFNLETYAANRGRLFPVARVGDASYVFHDIDRFMTFTGPPVFDWPVRPSDMPVPEGAVRFLTKLERIIPVPKGFWVVDGLPTGLSRYANGLVVAANVQETPLEHGGSCVWEDPAGYLWILKEGKLFRVERPSIETKILTDGPVCEYYRQRVSFQGLLDGRPSDELQYSWRLDDGDWSESSEDAFADIRFSTPGTHTLEVAAVGDLANIDTTPATFTFETHRPEPEVRIVSAPESIETDISVTIGYEVVRKTEGSRVTFQWRLDDGPWQDTSQTSVTLSHIVDGKHYFEVRAVQDDRFIQRAPASVLFEVKIDYDQIIREAITALDSEDYERRKWGGERLIAIGTRCVPLIESCIDEANEKARWWMEYVIWRLEDKTDE